MDIRIVRIFNTYGPRQSARAVIPTIMTQIATGKRAIKLGAVSPTRDFSFVADTVSGFVALAKSSAGHGEVINFGSGFEISIGETASLIAEVMGVEIEISTDEARLRPAGSEVDRLWCDNSKAKALLGWVPTYGGKEGFRRAIAITAEWFSRPENLARYKPEQYNI